MSNTTIQWTERTWNPVRGCSRISPGCMNCYAERMAARALPGHRSPTTGEPFAILTPSGPHWTGKVELIPHMLDIPLRRWKPTTWFVNSMSDLFHEDLHPGRIEDVFEVMRECPQHTFQILTKRAENMYHVMQPWAFNHDGVLPNVWLGVSVEDQQRADERVPLLLQTPAAVRFLSVEPLLGPVDLTQCGATGMEFIGESLNCERGIDWVIVGGESGPGARGCDLKWIRSIVEQCRAAGVPVFVKQLGAKPHEDCWLTMLRDPKGGDPDEWPLDLRVREMPAQRGAAR